MKKIIALLSFILIATVAMAQDQVFTAAGTKGVTNTPAARKTAAYNYVFQVSLPVPYRYVLQIRQNDEGGTPANNTSTAYFQGSADNTNWTNIDTLSYGGSSTYQVLTKESFKDFTGISHAPFYRELSFKYLRVNITPSDTIWVKSIWLTVLPVN